MNILNKLFRWKKSKTVRVSVLEKADFTDFGHATALLEANIPADGFLKRPEVWGKSHKEGFWGSQQDYVLLQTGEDIVTPNEKLRGRETELDILFDLSDEPELFEVADGKYVQDFRTWEDYYNLPAGVATFTGESARERYILFQKVEESGRLVRKLSQNRFRLWLSDNWGFAFLAVSLIISICVIIFGMRLGNI